MKCQGCGQDIPPERARCPNCEKQISNRRGLGATVGFRLGQLAGWLKTRPLVMAGLVMVLLVFAYRRFEPTPQQRVPGVQAQGSPAPTQVLSPQAGSNETQVLSSATHAKSSSALTAEDRQRLARVLESSFAQQDLDVTAVAAGDGNDTLMFTSEMFNDVNQRVVFMRGLRTDWEKELCNGGFRLVNLSRPGLLSDTHEFTLHCPRTAQERADFAASAQDDLHK
jgi:hypothetical protein